jgi:hypothetical protein
MHVKCMSSDLSTRHQCTLDSLNSVMYSRRNFQGASAMTIARRHLIDVDLTRWYHCMSRCVRGASLLGNESSDRKEWLETRIKELAQIFAIGVGGFSIMDNHLHLLLRLDPDVAAGWSEEEVVRRWGRLCPQRDNKRKPLPVSEEWVQARLKDTSWVAKARERLKSIGWFMKFLKEPLSRQANREDNCRGAFFQGRFRSVAVLDSEALLAVGIYIDLNPVAAKIADVPETSKYTSVKQRVDHIRAEDTTSQLEAAKAGSVAGSLAASGQEEKLWLCPIEDRRGLGSSREGMFEGLSIGSYLLLVDYTGRLFREGKARISADLAGILDRIGGSAESWQRRMEKLKNGRWFGRFFAASGEKLREMASRFNVRRVINLAGCAAW